MRKNSLLTVCLFYLNCHLHPVNLDPGLKTWLQYTKLLSGNPAANASILFFENWLTSYFGIYWLVYIHAYTHTCWKVYILLILAYFLFSFPTIFGILWELANRNLNYSKIWGIIKFKRKFTRIEWKSHLALS